MHALGSPDLSTSLVPIVSWYFNARARCGGRLFEQFRAGARTVYAHPGSTGSRRSGHIPRAAAVCPARPFTSGGKRRIWLFPSLGFYWGRYSPLSRRAKGSGPAPVRITPPAALVAHLPSQPPSHAITDAGNRFERHGNRAGVAAGGRTPPVWCERMNGVLLTALSGSQPLWIRGRRRFRRGNPLSEVARTMSDLHIFAIPLTCAATPSLRAKRVCPATLRFEPKFRQAVGPSDSLPRIQESKRF